MLASPLGSFTLGACDARLKKWRRRLMFNEDERAVCLSNLDALLDARLRICAGDRIEKPWETDEPVPDGA